MAATLDDLKDVLESIKIAVTEQKDILSGMLQMQVTRDRLASVDTSNSTVNNVTGSTSVAQSSSENGNIGLGLAGGLTGLGAGIAGFMASLSIGSMGLAWLGNDYTGLEDAFENFSKAVEKLSPEAIATIAGASVIAASTSSLKNLYGLGTASGMVGLGAGISGFLIGLALGDVGLGWIDNDYSNLGNALQSFSSAVENISLGTISTIAGIAGIAIANTAFGGNALSLALSMTGVAAGIAGFMGGLSLADSGLNWLRATTGADGSSLASAFKMFDDSIGMLSPLSIIALSGIVAAAAILPASSSIAIAANMTGVAAGISGFMGGLALGDAGLNWLQNIAGGDGSSLAAAFKMFDESVSSLSPTSILSLGGLILASAALPAMASVSIAANMTGIGAGIAGLMAGLTIGEKGISWINSIPSGSGPGIVSTFKIFNEAVMALDPKALLAVGALIAAGAAIGATGVGSVAVAAGLTGIGAGIAGFMSAIAVGDSITKILSMVTGGEPGEGLGKLFTNIFTGISSIKLLEGANLKELGDGLLSVAGGLGEFGKSTITAGLALATSAILEFFGAESAFDQIAKIADDAEKLEKGGNALDKIAGALTKFSEIKISANQFDFKQLAMNLGMAVPFLEALAYGGPVPGTEGLLPEFMGGGPIVFKKGLLDPSLRLDEMAEAISKVNYTLGVTQERPTSTVQESATAALAESAVASGTAESIRMQREAEIIKVAQIQADFIVIKNPGGSGSTNINADNSVKNDARTYVGGPTYIGGPAAPRTYPHLNHGLPSGVGPQ